MERVPLREALLYPLDQVLNPIGDGQSSTKAATRRYPASLLPMDNNIFDLENEAIDFFRSNHPVLSQDSCRPIYLVNTNVGTEEALRTCIEHSFHFPMNMCNNQPFGVFLKGATFPIPKGNADYYASDADGIFALCEVKTFWGLHGMEENKTALVHAYRTSESTNKYWRAISQVYGYMHDDGICYAVLSTYYVTWFMIAIDQNLYISDGYHHTRAATENTASFLQLLFYFYWKAKHDRRKITPIPIRRLIEEQFGAKADSESNETHFDRDTDSTYVTTESSSSQSEQQSSKRPRLSDSTLSYSDYSCYTFGELSFSSHLGGGAIDSVFQGEIDGEPVAIKIFDISKGGEPMYRHELAIYHELKAFQGKYVPRIVARASSGGNMEGFCMSLANRIETWTPELKARAKHALVQLAIEYNMLQQDIRPENFVVTNDGKVWVLDMEEVVKEMQYHERTRYMKSLSKVIDAF